MDISPDAGMGTALINTNVGVLYDLFQALLYKFEKKKALDIATHASYNKTHSIFPESFCFDGCCCGVFTSAI